MRKQRHGRYLSRQRDPRGRLAVGLMGWVAACRARTPPTALTLSPMARKEEGLKSLFFRTTKRVREPCWRDAAFVGPLTAPVDEKPWVALESVPFGFLMSSAVRAGSGCWRGKWRGQAALLSTEILIKVRLKAAPSVHIARARWTAAQHITAALAQPPEHQLFWGQGKPQEDVDLTSVPRPRDGRGHGQRAASWRRPREGTHSGQMSQGATFPTHPLGHGAIYGHRWVLLAKSYEGTTAARERGAVLNPSGGLSCRVRDLHSALPGREVGAAWTQARWPKSGGLPGASAMVHGAASGSGWDCGEATWHVPNAPKRCHCGNAPQTTPCHTSSYSLATWDVSLGMKPPCWQ